MPDERQMGVQNQAEISDWHRRIVVERPRYASMDISKPALGRHSIFPIVVSFVVRSTICGTTPNRSGKGDLPLHYAAYLFLSISCPAVISVLIPFKITLAVQVIVGRRVAAVRRGARVAIHIKSAVFSCTSVGTAGGYSLLITLRHSGIHAAVCHSTVVVAVVPAPPRSLAFHLPVLFFDPLSLAVLISAALCSKPNRPKQVRPQRS